MNIQYLTTIPLMLAFGMVSFPHHGAAAEKLAPAELAVSGRVEPVQDRFRLGAAINGIVAEIKVREGDRVQAGQILVELDCRSLTHELNAYEAERTISQANLQKLRYGPRNGEIAMASAAVRHALARFEEAEEAYKRVDILRERGATSRVRIVEAKRDALMAAAQLDEAREKLSLLQSGSREEEITEAESRLAQSIANSEQVKTRLSQCVIRAPNAGVVLSTHVTVGQLVGESNPVLLELVDDERLQVRGEINESGLNKICTGQGARVSVDAYPGALFRGRLLRIAPTMGRRRQSEDEGGQFDVREFILGIEGELRWPIGLRVNIELEPCGATAVSSAPVEKK